MGWIVTGEGMHHDASMHARYVPDLVRDPVHVALSKWHWTSNVIVGLALLAFGGMPYVLWGIFFRTTAGLHSTWLVNSATHKWGSRRFATRDDSTNNWWVALLTFGEGWHNNHHAYPTSARHGLAWYEVDLNWMGIRTLRRSVSLGTSRRRASSTGFRTTPATFPRRLLRLRLRCPRRRLTCRLRRRTCRSGLRRLRAGFLYASWSQSVTGGSTSSRCLT